MRWIVNARNFKVWVTAENDLLYNEYSIPDKFIRHTLEKALHYDLLVSADLSNLSGSEWNTFTYIYSIFDLLFSISRKTL